MRFISILCLLIFTTNANSADSKGNYAIWGSGNKSCHSYNNSRAEEEDFKFRDYIMGYLTSYNHQASETYSISNDMNLDEVLTWLDDLCQLKPVISFEEALVNFIIEHHESRKKTASTRHGFGR